MNNSEICAYCPHFQYGFCEYHVKPVGADQEICEEMDEQRNSTEY